MASPGPSSFEKVLDGFRKRLSPQDTELFQLTTFDDLKSSIKRIETEQAARKGLRNLNKIKPFLNGLKQYAGVLEVFVQVKPEIIAFIWGPIKLCLQVASKLNEAFDALLDAYELIGKSLPILSTVDALFCSHPHVNKVLADIFEDILQFHKRAIVFFKHGTWKLTFKLTYHTFSDLFGDVLKKLDRSRDLLLQSAHLAHFQESQEARILFAKEIEAMLSEKQNQRRLAVVEWLSSEPSSTIQHEEIRKIRDMLPQTTRWIFSQSQILDWLKRADYTPGTFWLCGIPGAGKTVIFNSVIDEISATLPDIQVIYFYCKNDDPLRSHFTDIAKNLILQILELNPNCLDFIYDFMLAGVEHRAKDASRLLQILDQILTNHDSLVIGIDGLDECSEEDRKLISNVIAIPSRTKDAQGVRIFVTSREEKDLERLLESALKFNIKPQHLEKDITSYINLKMAQLKQTFDFSQEREQRIRKEICTRPKGMFLLARLIMENLLSQESLEDLNEELKFEVLPHGIHEAYGRMLVRIGKASSRNPNQLAKRLQRAKLVLTLITTAHRPLYAHEIQGALAINIGERNVDFESRYLRSPLDDLCGPIIQLHQSGIVDLIHPTAKEYLWQHHSGHYIRASDAEGFMASFSTSYLTFECFSTELDDELFAGRVLSGNFAFYEYAACNWFKHLETLFKKAEPKKLMPGPFQETFLTLCARYKVKPAYSTDSKISRMCKEEFDRLLYEIHQLYSQTETLLTQDLEKEERMPCILRQIYRYRSVIEGHAILGNEQGKLEKYYGKSPFRCPVLQCPCFVTGFESYKEREKHDNDHQRSAMCPHDSCDYSVLGLPSAAALQRHLKLCHEDLPQTSTFPDIKTRRLEQALKDAIVANNLLAITALATELASFSKRKKGFVLRALTLGYREAALILLELLGTPSEIDYIHEKSVAILKVCEMGDEEIFDTLVKRGANININVRGKEAPLTIASQNCHLSIARRLLDNKMYNRDTSRCSHRRNGALVMATTNGHVDAVSLLLDKDSDDLADYHAKDIERALDAAIGRKDISCARLLLDWGSRNAPSNLPFKLRNIPQRNVDHMINDLWAKRDAGIMDDGGTKGNILQVKAYEGDYEAVSLLLGSGADINNLAGGYGTPLMAAAKNGKLEIICLLVDRGADIMRKDCRTYRHNGSAIDVAAANGHETVIRKLMDKGATFTNPSYHYSKIHPYWRTYTPLQLLSISDKSVALARLLLENGASADEVADASYLSTPLQIAAKCGADAILKLLLDFGADVNHNCSVDNGSGIDGSQHTPLCLATMRKDHSLIAISTLLSAKDIDINAKSAPPEGNTALHMAAKLGKTDLLEVLLDHGADINAINATEQTALMVGARCSPADMNYQQVMRKLIERGANVEMVDKNGDTALIIAAIPSNEGTEILQLLLEKGVQTNTINIAGSTALITAAYWGNTLGVEYMLQCRKSQYIEAEQEVWSAMISATSGCHVATVRVLLEFLSSADAKDHGSLFEDAFSRADVLENPDMLSLLEEYRASFISPEE